MLPHNMNYVVFVLPPGRSCPVNTRDHARSLAVDYQFHRIQLSSMFSTGRQNINPRRIDVAVSQDICQLSDIFLYRIKTPGKEMP